MKYKFLQNIVVSMLTFVTLIGLGSLNYYVSNYYHKSGFTNEYNTPPYFFLAIIGLLVIVQLICVFKFYKYK